MLTTGPENTNTNNMMDGVGMYAAPQYTNTFVKQKEKPVYGKAELILSALMFLFSFIFIKFVVYNVTGLISSLLFAAFFTAVIVYLRKKGFDIQVKRATQSAEDLEATRKIISKIRGE